MKSLITCVALLATAGGCVMQEHQSRRLTKKMAAQAYRSACDTPPLGRRARHFERGWKQGYFDVARGSDGKPPLVPPQCYWSFKYQNPPGQKDIATWYEGYQLGVLTAEQDGIRQFNVIPTGPDAFGPGMELPLEPGTEPPPLTEIPPPFAQQVWPNPVLPTTGPARAIVPQAQSIPVAAREPWLTPATNGHVGDRAGSELPADPADQVQYSPWPNARYVVNYDEPRGGVRTVGYTQEQPEQKPLGLVP